MLNAMVYFVCLVRSYLCVCVQNIRFRSKKFKYGPTVKYSLLKVYSSLSEIIHIKGRPFDSWGGGAMVFLLKKKIVQQIFENK